MALDLGASGSVDEALDELEALASTAGAEVVGRIVQTRGKPHVRTYLGAGKVEELVEAVRGLTAQTVIFDDDLSPSQQRHLEDATDCKVLDRTALILDIFAQHAHSSEGKLQVELAQLTYRLPRLRGKGVELSRLGGGIGTRGPGETKLEYDRRRIEKRISRLRRELKELAADRALQRKRRERRGVSAVCLVGYTNAGKSSLLNALTEAGVLVEDKLFATLDSTTRRLELPSRRVILLSDTVGFIKKLPHHLVEAFGSTFDEARASTLLLNVTDVSHSQMREQMEAVTEVLGELDLATLPRLDVFNKADLLDAQPRELLTKRYPEAALVSTKSGEGLRALLEGIDEALSRELVRAELLIPYSDGNGVEMVYGQARVLSEDFRPEGRFLRVELPRRVLGKLNRYLSPASQSLPGEEPT